MRLRVLLIAALAAPTLAGCGGLGGPLNGGGAAEVGSSAPAAASPPSQGGAPPQPAPAAAAQATPAPPPIPTGAALGGVLGGPVGASLSDSDRQAAWEAQIAALDSGKPRSWRGARGVFGSVEPGAETGAGCRAYSQTIYVAGRPNRGQGVACKQPDGGWKMTS
jgi:surface antigen